MRLIVVELANGLAFPAGLAETPAEEAAGVDVLGPRRALLFRRPGPVTLARTTWPLDLVWLVPTEAGTAIVVARERAEPGTSGYGLRRASSTWLLEVPASWGLQLAPGDVAQLHSLGT